MVYNVYFPFRLSSCPVSPNRCSSFLLAAYQRSLFLLQLFEKETSFRLLKPTWKRRMFDSRPVEVIGWITIAILTLKLSLDLSYLVFTTFFAKFFCLNLQKCGPWAGTKLAIEFHCVLNFVFWHPFAFVNSRYWRDRRHRTRVCKTSKTKLQNWFNYEQTKKIKVAFSVCSSRIKRCSDKQNAIKTKRRCWRNKYNSSYTHWNDTWIEISCQL